MKTTIETLWKTYGIINEWIRFSDTKAGAILTANGVIASIVLSKLANSTNFLDIHPIFPILLIIGTITTFLSIFFSIICLSPTLKVGDKTNSVLFFANIAERYKTHCDYEKKAHDVLSDEKQATNQIAQQVWANSKVAWKKYKAVAWATYFLEFTILIGIFSIIGILLVLI
jgi:hypothetical protein